jgi:hypothetical protein
VRGNFLGSASVSSNSPLPLESILCTQELHRRQARQPDHAAVTAAFIASAQTMANSPEHILRELVATALKLRARSARTAEFGRGASAVTECENRGKTGRCGRPRIVDGAGTPSAPAKVERYPELRAGGRRAKHGDRTLARARGDSAVRPSKRYRAGRGRGERRPSAYR